MHLWSFYSCFVSCNRFDIPENKDEFFTPVERALVLDYILRRTGYKAEDLVNTDDLYEPSARRDGGDLTDRFLLQIQIGTKQLFALFFGFP
ncbi:unnamed protein product [Trichobilharzia regenti]|nr:unnamed protein product [Trichobilharzia regenti]